MKRFLFLSMTAILALLPGCAQMTALVDQVEQKAHAGQAAQEAQTAQPPTPAPATKPVHSAKKAAPKPEPTQAELFEFVRGKLLTMSADDGINDNLEVALDPTGKVMTTTQPSGRCDQFLSSLDTNNLAWDIFDPSDSHNTRGELLRLTITSLSGKPARTCYDRKGIVDEGVTTNRVRLLFLLAKAQQIPGFQDRMTKAVKELILDAGAAPEKKLF
jgi:hypothetical protein